MKNLLIAFMLISFIAGCQSSDYQLHKVNEVSEVYYGKNITEEEAKKLGKFLSDNNYFNTKEQKSVRFSKLSDTFNVEFAVDKAKVESSSSAEIEFSITGAAIKSSVLNGQPTKVILSDYKFNGFKTIIP